MTDAVGEHDAGDEQLQHAHTVVNPADRPHVPIVVSDFLHSALLMRPVDAPGIGPVCLFRPHIQSSRNILRPIATWASLWGPRRKPLPAAYRSSMDGSIPFDTLDYVYMPSHDVAADVRYFVDVLGAQPVFAIDDGGTRVAMVQLGTEPPRLLLTDHLKSEAPILVFRVQNLRDEVARLSGRNVDGWRLELPMGPAFSWTAPGGQRVAIYEPTRVGVVDHFVGRRDF